jgi:cation diffusion facilitator family transporter
LPNQALAKSSSATQNAPMNTSLEQRTREINRVTLWGVFVNLILAVIKIVGGVFGHSQALLADGIHSLSDLASDGMVLYAAKHAGNDADDDHPYGHGRFETLATVILGAFLVLVSIGIAYDAFNRLVTKQTLEVPDTFTLAIALISILSNEGLYHFTKKAGLLINSKLLIANAWHHRSDAISSVVVLGGIIGSQMGVPAFDVIAAIIVALMIAKIGYDLGYQGVMELVDTALDPETVEQIKNTILSHEDVCELHMLRTRQMGHTALVDVHILVSPKLSVSEGHHISEKVERALIESFDQINDVTVHIDTENDEQESRSSKLPLRSELIIALTQAWSEIPELKTIDDITLHYLEGKITVEASLPLGTLDSLDDSDELKSKFRAASLSVDHIGDAVLKFH